MAKSGKKESPSVKRYFITAAQASYEEKENKEGEIEYFQRGDVADLNKPLMRNIERMCDDYGAEPIILKMSGKSVKEDVMHESLDGLPEPYRGNRALNNNIKISDMVVPPQNVDPSTGRLRFAQKDTTLVYAHSKQRLRAVPSSNAKLPKLLITTGAITNPNYKRTNHKGDVAFRDHAFGGVMVEVIGDETYNVRHVRAMKNGTLVDMGRKYAAGRAATTAKTEALVLGDIHMGDHDPKTMAANYEMIDHFQPQRLLLHDLLNGNSVNPHEKDNLITRAKQWKDGQLSIEKELKLCNAELNRFANAMGTGKVYVVASNHNFFLDRYLESGRIEEEPWNTEIALKLASKMVEGEDPVKAGIEMMGPLPSNVHFLDLEDDLKVRGYQLASHGHKGNSGARGGNAASRELAHGRSISGHSHTPEHLRDTIIVGTSTKLSLPYTRGSASSWMGANAVVYDNGLAQLLPIIQGKWKAKGFEY
ncbi:hypothetical protein HOA55_00180 [archaeon]|jgi:hypothetical protein|nr:hypothetical protein [archaeon]MBT3577879.1 hypothetical protein [archaeon]MBT6819757.1 hypothetical protein [archaeon]MBT6955964.1 hypothetical protein [archaeon]MBT7025539.1 hypothetical protein [archaeon]